MNDPDATIEHLAELLGHRGARRILEITYVDPSSPAEIAEASDVSLSTVCRRIEDLEAVGLLDGHTRIREDGHHDTVYSARFEGLSIDLDANGFSFDLERRTEDPIDRLHRLWGDL